MRTAIEMETATQASANKAAYYRSLTWQERLCIANYLNSIKFNYPENDPPRMDKTIFSMGKQEENDLENLKPE